MIIENKTVRELEDKLMDIKRQCLEISEYVDIYLKVLRIDDEDQDANGYWRMMDIVEAKIEDLAR